MIDKIKNVLKSKEKETDQKNAENQAKTKLAELEEKKDKIQQQFDEWLEYQEKVKALLPFEKAEMLEVEIKLLEAKQRIVHFKIEAEREFKNSSKDLDRLFIKFKDEIEAKREQLSDTLDLGRNKTLECNNSRLNKDPRIKLEKELQAQNKYQEVIDRIDEHINLMNEIKQNEKNILERVSGYNKGYAQQRLVHIVRNDFRDINQLKESYKKKVRRDIKAELEAVEKELEEVRKDFVYKEELTV